MKKIKPSFAFVYNFLFVAPVFIMTIVALVVGVRSNNVLIIIGYSLFFCCSGTMLVCILSDIQWVRIDESKLSVYNVFGRIKEYDVTKTKKVFLIDAVCFSLKGIRKTTPCRALS